MPKKVQNGSKTDRANFIGVRYLTVAQRIGNSIGSTIPAALVNCLEISQRDGLNWSLNSDGTLTVQPLKYPRPPARRPTDSQVAN